jgi:hypothetical protein
MALIGKPTRQDVESEPMHEPVPQRIEPLPAAPARENDPEFVPS